MAAAKDWSSSQFIQQLMQLLAGTGPQGYTQPIRQNLGMDIPKGGPFQTSGMTNMGKLLNGYTPRPVQPDQRDLNSLLNPIDLTKLPDPKPKTVTPAPKVDPGGMYVNKPGGGEEFKRWFQLESGARKKLGYE